MCAWKRRRQRHEEQSGSHGRHQGRDDRPRARHEPQPGCERADGWPERHPAQQSAIVEESEHVHEEQPCRQTGPGEQARPRAPARQTGLQRCGEQRAADADLKIEEAGDQGRGPGKHHEADLPPVDAAEQRAVEGDGAQRRQHEGQENQEGAQRNGGNDEAQDGREVVDPDIGVGAGPRHRIHPGQRLDLRAAGDEPQPHQMVRIVEQRRNLGEQDGDGEAREGHGQKGGGHAAVRASPAGAGVCGRRSSRRRRKGRLRHRVRTAPRVERRRPRRDREMRRPSSDRGDVAARTGASGRTAAAGGGWCHAH